jgi:hypothetical protein
VAPRLHRERMAVAMATGSSAWATAVFMSTPSTPCSMATQASEAVPTPASTMMGTASLRLISRMKYGFTTPSPLPMGEA